ncbi:HAD-superfamily phosphatase, subfamily IIIC/FkbH-like domain-containing protein [Streptomyces sp. 1222.5]|nr:HAD superfamily phosphatase (TIGR01681 family)/FkbH-like protein [Streptomyces sp. 5112.2]SED85257.1 HAD-superfamily phosphatase, subfamily IIIC/FkbH-like domain-containing protein [Streptomyces sp. 1222.5]SEE68951.1 HAD-superfamily phosphatase, subfamily IIIC/FkbH-like domain-containing protein [Streptomyces sp. 2231.1]
MSASEFRFSVFLSTVVLDSGILLAHGPRQQRIVLDAAWERCVRDLSGTVFGPEAFADLAPNRAAAPGVLQALRERHLIVPEGCDEEAALRASFTDRPESSGHDPAAAAAGSWPVTRYGLPPRLSDTAAAAAGAGEAVRVLLIGGCVTQFTEEPLHALGRELGLDVRIEHLWPGPSAGLARAVRRSRPDVTVYQPGVQPFLTGLFDGAHTCDDEERAHRLALMKNALTLAVRALADALEGSLGLVHNIAPPALSPFGRYDFAEEYGLRRLVAELNQHIDRCVRSHPHLMVVDEERLVARYGAAALFDDLVFPFGHHGGSVDPGDERPHQLPALGRALAGEYLACLRAHRGTGRIKLVVTDLDGTLWPGIAADDGFDWVDGDATSRWLHVGLHQALSVLKSRGVLLATCSKGDAHATLGVWEEAGGRLPLAPGDFVLHRINWRPKSENIADLCARLGFTPDQVLFLDDNPVERAEAAAALPGLHIAEGPVHGFRELLLTSAALEAGRRTEEAARRTDTTRAMLRREELRSGLDRDAFLRSLDVRVRVAEAGPEHLARAAELFNRTNQFTTTAWRTGPEELRRVLAEPGTRLHVAHVSDRFGDYGLTGACLVRGGTVTAFALSCRVIGLDVAVPFLVAALEDGAGGRRAALAGLAGRIVVTDRNTPARELFLDAGFGAAGDDGLHVLADPGRLPELSALPVAVLSAAAAGPGGP